jgi:O-antigen ligase
MLGNPVDIKEPAALFFEGKERLASGRGYIWSRTIPLIKDKLFLGWGPDNFYYAFPQNDYMGKLKFMYSAYMPVDMAHSMYLQTAVETGVVSLLIFILLILLFVFTKIRTVLVKPLEQENTRISVSAIAVIAAYMVCGIFTDANAITMMIFWPLVGIYANVSDIFVG